MLSLVVFVFGCVARAFMGGYADGSPKTESDPSADYSLVVFVCADSFIVLGRIDLSVGLL
jgi:hypothetical protein